MRNKAYSTELVTEETIRHENGTQSIFVYYLQTIRTEKDEYFYALRVDKLSRDGILLEREETYALTDSKPQALAMAQAFARGTVPPSVLMEMADEWLMQSVPWHTYHMAG